MNLQEYMRPKKKTDKVQKQAHVVSDMVLLGSWDDVKTIPTEQLRKWTNEPEKLDGLIIKGYEMKWTKTNENGERYDKEAFDEFIQSYFVERGLNMPVDINHGGDYDWRNYCGRVLYIETNNVGFYFVVYVPRTYAEYDRLVWALENGIVQGFSKQGFVGWDDYDYVWNEDGSFDHEQIHKMRVTAVSLVCTPANGLAFEKMQQTKNALTFENKTKAAGKTIADLFK